MPLGQRLAATARAADRALDQELVRRGGSRTVYRVLHHLATRPAGNQAEVAEAMGLTGQTLSHHLGKLEAEGLLTRHRDPMDRRAHLVELTDAGHARLEEMRQTHREHERQLVSRLDPEEVDELERLLARVDRVFGVPAPTELERWLASFED
ncbi:MarR family transcriptional regulator [Pseudonocardia ailaonensis]